tara:strand:+ start:103 stop:1014 length:912 start_codon:yes stop_codon:yes gene_type:complete
MNIILRFFFISITIGLSRDYEHPYIVTLGIAQDGGSPQAGCEKVCCKNLWKSGSREKIACIGIVDPQQKKSWMIDATLDFPEQYRKLTIDHKTELAGIFLTHAHIGHYAGLMHVGREIMGEKNIPVFMMEKMEHFFQNNGPWDQLIKLKNIKIKKIRENEDIKIGDRLFIEPFLVPHRDEYSETVGYRVMGRNKSLVYIPDIDKWEKWEQNIFQVILNNDTALLDGTFFSQNEIPHRDMSEIPHPFIVESIELLFDLSTPNRQKVHFIHLNHSNPAIKLNSPEYNQIRHKGFNISRENDRFNL